MDNTPIVICATGHRPDKLGGYGEAAFQRLYEVAAEYLSKMRPDEVISGMAQGWDQAFAMAACNLNIPIIAAVPFEGQDRVWPAKARVQYQWLLNKAARVTTVTAGPYEAWKMQVRNQWMVDHSDRVCALYDGSKGGTYNCIRYAIRKRKPIDNLYSDWVASY